MGETMKSKFYVRSAMLTVLLSTLVVSRVALAVDEAEPNDPYTSVQPLTIGSDGTVTVTNASIYNTTTHRDVDFYSFHGNAGDIVTFNIDGGMNASYVGILTTLGVWGPDYASNPLPLITQTHASTISLCPRREPISSASAPIPANSSTSIPFRRAALAQWAGHRITTLSEATHWLSRA